MLWDLAILLVVSGVAAFLLSPADQVTFLFFWLAIGGIAIGAYCLGLVRSKKRNWQPGAGTAH